MLSRRVAILFVCLWAGARTALAQAKPDGPEFDVREHYTKVEYRIPMRDGVRLFTAVYVPKDSSHPYPFLINRTPYSVAPYGVDQYRTQLGPAPEFDQAGYIFVMQDVRGRFMSEGRSWKCVRTSTSRNPKPMWTTAAICTTPSSGC